MARHGFATIGTAVSIVAASSAGAMLGPAIDAWQDCNKDIWVYSDRYLWPIVVTVVALGIWFSARGLAKNNQAFDGITWVGIGLGGLVLLPLYFLNFVPWSEYVAEFRQGCGISDASAALHSLIMYAPLASIALARLVCPARRETTPWRLLLMAPLIVVLWLGLASLPI